jgi:hypothetical protein
MRDRAAELALHLFDDRTLTSPSVGAPLPSNMPIPSAVLSPSAIYAAFMVDTAADPAAPRLASWPSGIGFLAAAAAFAEAYIELISLTPSGALGFRAVHTAITRTPVATRPVSYDALGLVRAAVRDACIFYPTHVWCLQRSAAVVRMLRRRGLNAQLVIGFLPAPLECHAWVELNNSVVWDARPALAHFRVLDRI